MLFKKNLKSYIDYLKKSDDHDLTKHNIYALHRICACVIKAYKRVKAWHPKRSVLLDSSPEKAMLFSKWAKGKQYMISVGLPLLEPYQPKSLYWLLERESSDI